MAGSEYVQCTSTDCNSMVCCSGNNPCYVKLGGYCDQCIDKVQVSCLFKMAIQCGDLLECKRIAKAYTIPIDTIWESVEIATKLKYTNALAWLIATYMTKLEESCR